MVNPDKFQFTAAGKEVDHESLEIDIKGFNIKAEKSVDLLGIEVDNQLNFKEQVCRQAARQNALRRISKYLNPKLRMIAFNSFIRSQFNYCPLIWGDNNKTQTTKLEKLQERALRIVFNDYDSSYEILLSRAGIDSLASRRRNQLANVVCKAVNGIAPPYICDLFNIKTYSRDMRGTDRLDVPRVNTTTYGLKSLRYRGKSLRYRGAKLWNALAPCFTENMILGVVFCLPFKMSENRCITFITHDRTPLIKT